MPFEILHRSICLHRPTSGYHTHGDVARLVDGRLIARCEVETAGGRLAVCREWHDDEDPATTPGPVTQDWWRWQYTFHRPIDTLLPAVAAGGHPGSARRRRRPGSHQVEASTIAGRAIALAESDLLRKGGAHCRRHDGLRNG